MSGFDVGDRVKVVGFNYPTTAAVKAQWLGREGIVYDPPDEDGYLYVRFDGVYVAVHHTSELEAVR